MSTVTSPDGTRIDYDSYGGSGPVVVFIGGAVQHRMIDPRTTAAAQRLGDNGFTAVDYDRRGRGNSGDTPPWALKREVEDVAALIGATGGAATLYGSSSGAAVALAAAVADIGVTGLMLYEPPFFAGADKSHQITAIEGLLAQGNNDAAMRYNLTVVIGIPPEIVDGMTDVPSWPAMCAVAHTLVYDLAAVNAINTDPDWQTRWAPVKVPARLYSGTNSFPALAGAAKLVADAVPGAGHLILDGQDHSPTPRAMTEAVMGFHGSPT